MMSRIEEIPCSNNEGFILAAAQHPRLHSCIIEENESLSEFKNNIVSALGKDDDIAVIPLGDNYYLAEVMYDTMKDLKVFKEAFQSVKKGLAGIETNFEDGLLYVAETDSFNAIKDYEAQRSNYINALV